MRSAVGIVLCTHIQISEKNAPSIQAINIGSAMATFRYTEFPFLLVNARFTSILISFL